VAYRDGHRYEPRFNRLAVQLQRQSDLRLPPSTDRFQMVLPETRMITYLEFVASEEQNLEDHRVWR